MLHGSGEYNVVNTNALSTPYVSATSFPPVSMSFTWILPSHVNVAFKEVINTLSENWRCLSPQNYAGKHIATVKEQENCFVA